MSRFIALAFAACCIVMQFHQLSLNEQVQNNAQIFHIEEISTTGLDGNIDNRFVFPQRSSSKQIQLSQQKHTLYQQRQYLGQIEQKTQHPFRQFKVECLAAICQNYEDKLVTSLHHLTQLELTLELSPVRTFKRIKVLVDEPASQFSLS